MERELIGRRGVLDRLVRWLDDPKPAASAVELVGAPGLGKTALLDAVVAAAPVGRGGLVVRTAATAVEQPLTWAGLAQLAGRWDADDLAALSASQRDAIDGALGRGAQPPEPGTVATAVAALVDVAATRGPVVLVIDDAHWLDAASAGVIAFAVRANRRHPVRLVCARRPTEAPLEPERLVDAAAFERIELEGLTTAGVHDVLSSLGVELGRPQLVLVHEATGGNPLHVIELGRRLAAGEPVEDAVRQTSLESVIGQRVRGLTAATQAVLGAAALTATPTIAVLVRCFDDATVEAALAEAEAAELMTLAGTTVRFAHPTVTAAAEAALGSLARRRLHAMLADVVADERALHLDLSTDGPDPMVADALHAAAHDAWERGATEAAARRMARAVERTPAAEVDERWRRRIDLANMLLDVGAARDAAAALDAGVEPTPPGDPMVRATVSRVRGSSRFQSNDEAGAVEEFASVAAMFPPGHPTRVDALFVQARAGVFLDLGWSVGVAAQAAEEALATGDPELIERTAACELASRFLAGEPVVVPDTRALHSRRLTASELVDEALLWNDDLDRAEPAILERIADAEQRGDLASVANLSLPAGEARMRRGDLHGARARYELGLDAASTMDDRAWIATSHASLALTSAYLGDSERVELHLEEARAAVPGLSLGDQLAVRSSIGIAALLRGDAADAVVQLRAARAVTLRLRLHDSNALPFRAQLVEALLAVDEADEAREVSAELTRFASAAGRTRGIGDAHRAAALVAAADGDLDAARTSAEAAIAAHDRLPGPIEGAWSRLVAGVVERRSRKRAVARAHFEQARDACLAVGAEALARRADADLERTATTTGGAGQLTPSEERVAHLVVLGHTNAEIAALLHMSARTVESNLSRIYRKLGIRSRTELAVRRLS